MRIAIVGTGGVGGYFGAKLKEAGYEVCFFAKGKHFEAIKTNGLKVYSPCGDVEISNVEVYNTPTSVPKVDLALSCVKLYDADNAAKICAQILKPNGAGVSLQNGLDGPAFLEAEIGSENSIAGSVIISAYIESPGVIRHVDTNQFFNIEDKNNISRQLADACIEAGFSTKLVKDAQVLLWTKFIRLVPLSGIAVLSRSNLGVVCANSHLLEILRCLVDETLEVGRALGVELEDGVIDKILSRIGNAPEFKPSLLLDLERGKKLEARWLAGKVAALGRQLGVATPYNDCVLASLIPFEQGQG